jgi:uncharacterized membrane protein
MDQYAASTLSWDQAPAAPATASAPAWPDIRRIGLEDVIYALRRGTEDFLAVPTQLGFLCLIYPVVGRILAYASYGYGLMQMVYPLTSGFALLGPLAAVGLYEISRQRELGRAVSWRNAFDVLRSPSLFSILVMGLVLLALFGFWLRAAQAIYLAAFGPDWVPASILAFLHAVLFTPNGHWLIVVGNLVGFVFALVVLAISVVSFPLLVDRDVGPIVAVVTSVRAVLRNPWPMAVWGLAVAVLLAVGCATLFIGLGVVMPMLGHATWHFYRRVVVPDQSAPANPLPVNSVREV